MTRISATLFVLLLMAPPSVRGQEVQFGAVRMWPGHELLGRPMGLRVVVDGRPGAVVGVRLGLEGARDRFGSFGSTCVGLMPPSGEAACAPEDVRNAARIGAVSVGVPVTVSPTDRLRIALVPEVRTVWVESEELGATSGRTRSADKHFSGLGIGVEVRVRPTASRSVWLVAGAYGGNLTWFEDEVLIDGYSPFEGRLAGTRIGLGLVVHGGS